MKFDITNNNKDFFNCLPSLKVFAHCYDEQNHIQGQAKDRERERVDKHELLTQNCALKGPFHSS